MPGCPTSFNNGRTRAYSGRVGRNFYLLFIFFFSTCVGEVRPSLVVRATRFWYRKSPKVCEIEPALCHSSIENTFSVNQTIPERGAVVEWLEQLGYGAESRRIA